VFGPSRSPGGTVDTRPAEHPGSQVTGWRRALALKPDLADFDRRGFRTGPAATRATLEGAGRAFLAGFNAELASTAGQAVDLDAVPAPQRGFAVEGAAMAAAMLDTLRPGTGRRLAVLHDAHAGRYGYLLYVGAGWATATLRLRRLPPVPAPPLLRWLGYDGMGFCQAYFARPRALRRWYAPHPACPASCDIRYQGLGRALWFRACGDPQALAGHLAAIPARHRDDVWSGVALAATYAGGVPAGGYPHLLARCGRHGPALAQGAAFAAEARRQSGEVPEHTRQAVAALAGTTVDTAADWTWQARAGLAGPDAGPAAYRQWRSTVAGYAAGRRPAHRGGGA